MVLQGNFIVQIWQKHAKVQSLSAFRLVKELPHPATNPNFHTPHEKKFFTVHFRAKFPIIGNPRPRPIRHS